MDIRSYLRVYTLDLVVVVTFAFLLVKLFLWLREVKAKEAVKDSLRLFFDGSKSKAETRPLLSDEFDPGQLPWIDELKSAPVSLQLPSDLNAPITDHRDTVSPKSTIKTDPGNHYFEENIIISDSDTVEVILAAFCTFLHIVSRQDRVVVWFRDQAAIENDELSPLVIDVNETGTAQEVHASINEIMSSSHRVPILLIKSLLSDSTLAPSSIPLLEASFSVGREKAEGAGCDVGLVYCQRLCVLQMRSAKFSKDTTESWAENISSTLAMMRKCLRLETSAAPPPLMNEFSLISDQTRRQVLEFSKPTITSLPVGTTGSLPLHEMLKQKVSAMPDTTAILQQNGMKVWPIESIHNRRRHAKVGFPSQVSYKELWGKCETIKSLLEKLKVLRMNVAK